MVEEISELDFAKELSVGEIKKATVVKIEKGTRREFFSDQTAFEDASPEDKMIRVHFKSVDQEDFWQTFAFKNSPKSNLGKYLDRYKRLALGMEVMAMRGGDGYLKVVL